MYYSLLWGRQQVKLIQSYHKMRAQSFRRLILVMLLCVTYFPIFAQKSDRIKPQWLHSSVKPSNNTFTYEIIHSNSRTLTDARTQALSDLLIQNGLESGRKVKTDIVSTTEERHTSRNNSDELFSNETIKINTQSEGEPVTLTAKKIDEYWERRSDGSYNLATLYARSSVNGTPQFDHVKLTSNYGVHGLWRSAIIPGWGQLYKGSTTKGSLILGGTAICIGAIIYTDCIRNSYTSKISQTHSASQKKAYANRRTTFTTGRNICIGTLGALYVYNIIDAIVAPGARRILTSPAGTNKYSYFWSPVVTDNNGIGIVATISF